MGAGWIRARAPATIANLGPGFDVFVLAVRGPADEVAVRPATRDSLQVHGVEAAASLRPSPETRQESRSRRFVRPRESRRLSKSASSKASLPDAAWAVRPVPVRRRPSPS